MWITDREALARYADENRLWQGIPGIEVTTGGRIFVCFYSGGTREEVGNYVLLYTSQDGVDFSLTAVAAPEEGQRCFDPCLWIDPLGRLWQIWSSAPDNGVHAVICNAPDAPTLCWNAERIIGTGVMMNKPTVLSTGEWLFPIAMWDRGVDTGGIVHELTCRPGSYVWRSVDCGEHFVSYGYADVPKRSFDEHMVVELAHGVLMMPVRTLYGIGVSYSYDSGKTWTRGVDSGLGGPSSRFCIRRLRSGRLLLVNHYNFRGRNNLTAMLSEDDGKTYPYRLLLDGRNSVSYPDIKEAEDGYLYIVYDRERGAYHHDLETTLACAREILYAKITERDILEGRLSEGSALRLVVNALGEYRGEPQNPYDEVGRYTDRQLAERLLGEGEGAIDRLFDLYPVHCLRPIYPHEGEPDVLIERFRQSGCEDAAVLEKLVHLLRRAYIEPAVQPIVERVVEYLDTHFAENFTVGELAATLRCSVYYLCHKFKAGTGMTLLDYRNRLRLFKAKTMLASTEWSILEIANVCGYESESYFGKIFVREEGVTPAVYRATVRGR